MWTLYPIAPIAAGEPCVLATDDAGFPICLGRADAQLLTWLYEEGHEAVTVQVGGHAIPYPIAYPSLVAAAAAARDLAGWLAAADAHPSWPTVAALVFGQPRRRH